MTQQTALMAASLSGREFVVRELLAKGADIHNVMTNSIQATHLAASNGNVRILQVTFRSFSSLKRITVTLFES